MRSSHLVSATLLASLCISSLARAQDTPITIPAETQSKVEAIRQEAAKRKDEENAFLAKQVEAQLKLQDVQQQRLKVVRNVEETKKALAEAEGQLKKEQEAATKAEAPKQTAETAASEAAAALASAQKKVAEAKAALDTATKAAADAKAAAENAPNAEDTPKPEGDPGSGEQPAEDKAAVAKAAETARQAAEKTATEAAQALAAAEKKAEETKKAAEAATKTFNDAQAAAQKTESSINELKGKLASLGTEVSKFDDQLAAIKQEITSAEQAAEQARAQWLQHSKSAEALLKDAGAWVSFADEIAPIFHDRCLACHNARIAKGRYNMENFAAVMKGGESGSVVDPGDADSLLCILIDDGSMPKEADPLTAEQIAITKRWIQLGAHLDAGVDALAPLLQIMPKRPQPSPPDVYPAAVPITAIAFSPDGTLLASSGYHEVLLWSVETGELVRRISNVAERTYGLVFHPDGTRLAAASGTPGQIGEVKLFQVADGALLANLATVEDAMFDVSFSPDGQRLAAGGADRAIRIFDTNSFAEVLRIEDHADWVLSIDWSSDGAQLVSASRDKTCKLFDAKSGDSKGTFNGHGDVVAAAAFLADGKQVVSGGRDKQLRVWKVDDTKEVRKVGGFGDEITHLTLLPSDHVLVASADKNGRVINTADGKTLKTLSGHQDWLYSSAAHPNSGVCATGSYDGEIRLWKLDDATLIRQWIAKP